MTKKMKKIRDHIERWNKWRKYNANSPVHKLLVLFGLRKSPTFAFVFTDKEEQEFHNAFLRGIEEGPRIDEKILRQMRERDCRKTVD